MNLAQRIEKAMKLVVVPEDRHAKLWLNREGAEEIWRVLKDLYDRERESDVDSDKKWAWKFTEPQVETVGDSVVLVHGQPITLSVPKPEESPQTTALDPDGVYMIQRSVGQAWAEDKSGDDLVTSKTPSPQWMVVIRGNMWTVQFTDTPEPGVGYIVSGQEALKLSRPATEAQEPGTQQGTRSGSIGCVKVTTV